MTGVDRTEYFRKYRKERWAANKERDSAVHSEWRKANKERRNAYQREWHQTQRAIDPINHAKKIRRHVIKRRYGITPEEYDALLALQNGHCALCDGRPDQERYGYLHIDHCHDTGKVRGLLCQKCNHGLGKLGDNEARLLKALQYVRGTVGVI